MASAASGFSYVGDDDMALIRAVNGDMHGGSRQVTFTRVLCSHALP